NVTNGPNVTMRFGTLEFFLGHGSQNLPSMALTTSPAKPVFTVKPASTIEDRPTNQFLAATCAS
ncbi:MAG: hypothetical protein P1U50_09890, partial [Parvibaculaceae bacterium]|nr:hypothetical protein [Parvibaculaceae bacterium]